jgi:hypothetical protein
MLKWFRRKYVFSPTLILVVTISIGLFIYRLGNISNQEFSWDVLGYYLPLPATFIEGDPLLDDKTWVEELNDEKKLSGTLYQVSSTPEGKPMYFFFFGMSYFYSVFFFAGHWFSGILGFPQDGFSEPYQIAVVLGCMIYVTIGLFLLRKILLNYFTEKISIILILVLVFGTNYIHHLTLKNLEPVSVLFMLSAFVIWQTIRWHFNYSFKNLMGITLGISLMAMVKPSEILFVFVPILWGIHNKESLLDKLRICYQKKYDFLKAFAICSVIFIPQIAYWYIKTGHLIYDSYKNPGVGLDLFSPHILDALFSYRKGWLLYTPLMFFAIVGFYFLWKQNRKIFPAIFISIVICFYLVASWSEWWYGAGFSLRPMITYYPLLLIPLGYFISTIHNQNKIGLNSALLSTFAFCIFLNQFQWWQLKNGILDPYRTTKEYYWATFLKTNVSESDKQLLLVNREIWGETAFSNKGGYNAKIISDKKFNELPNGYLESPENQEFALSTRIAYEILTPKDHIWVTMKFKYRAPEASKISLALMVDREEGPYGYMAFPLDSCDGNWHEMTLDYLTPEIRNHKDEFKFDFWKEKPSVLSVDDFQLTIFEKK